MDDFKSFNLELSSVPLLQSSNYWYQIVLNRKKTLKNLTDNGVTKCQPTTRQTAQERGDLSSNIEPPTLRRRSRDGFTSYQDLLRRWYLSIIFGCRIATTR